MYQRSKNLTDTIDSAKCWRSSARGCPLTPTTLAPITAAAVLFTNLSNLSQGCVAPPALLILVGELEKEQDTLPRCSGNLSGALRACRCYDNFMTGCCTFVTVSAVYQEEQSNCSGGRCPEAMTPVSHLERSAATYATTAANAVQPFLRWRPPKCLFCRRLLGS